MKVVLAEYEGKCGCGREHKLKTKTIIIEAGAVNSLLSVAGGLGITSGGFAVCDSNTREYAGMAVDKAKSIFNEQNPVVVLDAAGLRADENAVTFVENHIAGNAKWLLAAGTGVIHDITRHIAHKREIPFISFPTACTVDGFASPACAMAWQHLKKTVTSTAPVAVIADTDIFIKAPYRLTTAGVSDSLGKYVSLADWQCGKLVGDEEFCDKIYSMIKKSVDGVREYLPAIHAGDTDAYELLMYALIMSGVAVQLWGDSRPVSGSEHHFTHFWDMCIINGRLDALHGEKVGLGLLVSLRYYKKIGQVYNLERTIQPYAGMPLPLMRKLLGTLYEDILKENQPDPLRSISPEKMLKSFEGLQEIIKGLPSVRQLRPYMQATGCLTTPEDIGLSRDVIPESIILAPFIRRRLTVMRASKLLPI